MKLTHVYTGTDGDSHFAQRELRGAWSSSGWTSVDFPGDTAAFRNTDTAITSEQFTLAPRRQLVILLQGRVEYECSDGAKKEFGVGDIVLFDDTTGGGHRARPLEEPRIQMFVRIPGDVDIDVWTLPEETSQ